MVLLCTIFCLYLHMCCTLKKTRTQCRSHIRRVPLRQSNIFIVRFLSEKLHIGLLYVWMFESNETFKKWVLFYTIFYQYLLIFSLLCRRETIYRVEYIVTVSDTCSIMVKQYLYCMLFVWIIFIIFHSTKSYTCTYFVFMDLLSLFLKCF